MAVFVPQHGLPIDRVAAARGGAVGGDDFAETDTQVARVVGHAEGSDAEILLLREDLDGGGGGEFEAVFRDERGAGAFEKSKNTGPVDGGLVGAHAHEEMVVGQGGEGRHGVLQGDEIVGGDVVRVGFVNLLGQRPAFVLFRQGRRRSVASWALARRNLGSN